MNIDIALDLGINNPDEISNNQNTTKTTEFSLSINNRDSIAFLEKEDVLKKVKGDGYALEKEKKFNNDKDVVLAAMKNSRRSFEYAGNIIKNDKNSIMDIIKTFPGSVGCWFEFISDDLKDDDEIVKSALLGDGCILEHASRRLKQDKEIVLLAIEMLMDNWSGISTRWNTRPCLDALTPSILIH